MKQIVIYNSTKNGNFIDDISKVDVVFQPQDDAEFQEETITEESAVEDLLEEHEMEEALQENEDEIEEETPEVSKGRPRRQKTAPKWMEDFETAAKIATEEALIGHDATEWSEAIKKEIIYNLKNGTLKKKLGLET